MTSIRPSEDAAPTPDVFFPQQTPDPSGVMQALIAGDLVLVGRCLRLLADSGSKSYLLIWPSGVSVRGGPQEVTIVDESGTTVAQVGRPFAVGGGEPGSINSVEMRPSPPLECGGPYWVVGEILGRTE